MSTNRRTAIKYFVLFSAGIALLPSCDFGKKNTTAYPNLPIDEDDEAMLSELSDTLIPATDTPGGKELGLHFFSLTMLNDCYEQNERDRYAKGMKQWASDVQKKYNKPFAQCTATEKQAVVAEANDRKKPEEETDADYFFRTTKQLTIRGYTNSEYYLSNIQVYKLVPGKYKASVPV